MSKTAVLELRHVDKSFGPIDVLHDISLKVNEGEVLCLLGDNGAGKSTLIKTLSGVHQPTRGQMLMDGQEVSFARPRDAQDRGIATVHQFGGTYPLMSVGRNFFVGAEPTKGWGPFKVFDREKANEIAVKSVQDFGITRITDGDRLVGGLPICSSRKTPVVVSSDKPLIFFKSSGYFSCIRKVKSPPSSKIMLGSQPSASIV